MSDEDRKLLKETVMPLLEGWVTQFLEVMRDHEERRTVAFEKIANTVENIYDVVLSEVLHQRVQAAGVKIDASSFTPEEKEAIKQKILEEYKSWK